MQLGKYCDGESDNDDSDDSDDDSERASLIAGVDELEFFFESLQGKYWELQNRGALM